jgi:hypothetical protein
MDICEDINKRIEKFINDYQKKMFGKAFFLDVEYRNVLIDLIWYREDRLKTHIHLCRINKLPEDSFAIQHARYYLKRLKDIEFKSFIHVMRLNTNYSWFGFSQKRKDEMNKELCEIAKKVVEKMKKEKL